MGKQIVEGKIDKIFTKDFGEADRFGNQYAVNINVNGSWYGLGKKKKPEANVKVGGNWHTLAEGDVVEFVAESRDANGKTYWNARSSDITVKQASSQDKPQSRNTSPSPSAGSDPRQDSIMRQSAMGYAATLVAGTLTSKSDPKEAAQVVVEIAQNIFVPYAKHGTVASGEKSLEQAELERVKKEEEGFNEWRSQQAQDEPADFDDDITF